ncbi:hypothetical protein HPB48_010286 [Haemaphysalis longicornis]|uniref:Uncharacterized protein n=1 Tax=Haemaphysalis longicornis TaxID=44386 RepID=A0A9J6FU42_HAELO|nr:hypothetical protein HPB48_010286 [Haemaphysalis longicornis]
MGPYKAPAPSESMLKAMASQGPVFAERFYNDDYEDADENRNYVEVQVFERTPSGTIISREPGGGEGGARRTQSYYVDVPPVHVSARPAYDDYYEERPLSRRERQSKQSLYFEESVGPPFQRLEGAPPYDRMERLERLDRLDRLDRLERLDQLKRGRPASSVAVSRQPSQMPITLPPTTVVVNLGESIGPPATVSGYDLQRHPSQRSQEEVRAPRYQQPPPAPLTTQMTQKMRELARQYQQPMGDDVVSMTERVIYEVIRKKESATESSEGAASPTPVK